MCSPVFVLDLMMIFAFLDCRSGHIQKHGHLDRWVKMQCHKVARLSVVAMTSFSLASSRRVNDLTDSKVDFRGSMNC